METRQKLTPMVMLVTWVSGLIAWVYLFMYDWKVALAISVVMMAENARNYNNINF